MFLTFNALEHFIIMRCIFFTENFDNDINLTERVNYAIGHPEAEENQISDYSNNIKEVDYIKR